MGWANASYLEAVRSHIGGGFRTGKNALRYLREDGELSGEARSALRRYSTSSAPAVEDGKLLNRALRSGGDTHREWAEALDGAFVWSFEQDVVLWRGGRFDQDEASCFVSTSLVERSARKFASRAGGELTAILLPAGSPVAVPAGVWASGDDARTLTVVGREVEIILPRGTVFDDGVRLHPFAAHPQRGHVSFAFREAVAPAPSPPGATPVKP